MINMLKKTGQLEKTLILFMSDHGELLGDHGLLYKGCRFFDSLVRVPLIFSLPGVTAENLITDALVELVDIPETLLELAGIPIPNRMQGKSLVGLLKNETDTHKTMVVSEYHDAIGFTGSEGSHGTMSYDGKHKLCLYHGHDVIELYDMENDPEEKHNIWYDPETSSEKKVQLLKQHIIKDR